MPHPPVPDRLAGPRALCVAMLLAVPCGLLGWLAARAIAALAVWLW